MEYKAQHIGGLHNFDLMTKDELVNWINAYGDVKVTKRPRKTTLVKIAKEVKEDLLNKKDETFAKNYNCSKCKCKNKWWKLFCFFCKCK